MNIKPKQPEIGTFVLHENTSFVIWNISKNIFGTTLYSLYRGERNNNVNVLIDNISFWHPRRMEVCWFWDNDVDIPVCNYFKIMDGDKYVTIDNW